MKDGLTIFLKESFSWKASLVVPVHLPMESNYLSLVPKYQIYSLVSLDGITSVYFPCKRLLVS